MTLLIRVKRVTRETRGKEPMVPLRTPPFGSPAPLVQRFDEACAFENNTLTLNSIFKRYLTPYTKAFELLALRVVSRDGVKPSC